MVGGVLVLAGCSASDSGVPAEPATATVTTTSAPPVSEPTASTTTNESLPDATTTDCDIDESRPCVVKIAETGSIALIALGEFDQTLTLSGDGPGVILGGMCAAGGRRDAGTWSLCGIDIDGRLAVIGFEPDRVSSVRAMVDDEMLEFPLHNQPGEATMLPGVAWTLELFAGDVVHGSVSGPF